MISIKIIISGLDNAGKTSILTALDKRYNFEQEIEELQPTKKIEYHQTQFLNKSIAFWDMGGQERYRKLYIADPDFYFANTNLLLYIIDIQDRSRFKLTLEYLNVILEYFEKNNIEVILPVLIETLLLLDLQQIELLYACMTEFSGSEADKNSVATSIGYFSTVLYSAIELSKKEKTEQYETMYEQKVQTLYGKISSKLVG